MSDSMMFPPLPKGRDLRSPSEIGHWVRTLRKYLDRVKETAAVRRRHVKPSYKLSHPTTED